MEQTNLTKFGTVMRLGPADTNSKQNSQFRKYKMAATAILKKRKILIVRNRLTDFDKLWHADASPPSGT